MNRKRQGRHIVKRIIVRGNLILDTPTCLGNGDAEGSTDMMLLRDSISSHALLTGSSIAGALRNYLHEYESNYGTNENRQNISALLFGDLFAYQNEKDFSEGDKLRIKEQDNQSGIIIHDAISNTIPQVELRDGVKIDGKTGTPPDKAKYDLELLSAGTEFPLHFELLIEKDNEELLTKALALALNGLKKGEIGIGMKKRRGFGCTHVDKWQIWEFDFTKHRDRISWLCFERSWHQDYPTIEPRDKLFSERQVRKFREDKREKLSITAKFKLVSPLLIRSGQDLVQNQSSPDTVHLHSFRDDDWQPIVSGTSLAGVLRHRADKIINTLGIDKNLQIVENLFGFVNENSKQAKASRLIVHESIINSTSEIVQNRIAIDRFTGGAFHGALFEEQPVFSNIQNKDKNNKKKKDRQNKQTENIQLKLELLKPEKHEIGLLMLLLKDLWTRELPIGGTTSIGRGRLQGIEATIRLPNSSNKCVISQENGTLKIKSEDKQQLEDYLQELVNLKDNVSN